ncbi:MAG: AAA family ATPase [Candidatus Latescibacteria bacterium]|nr:AAA family ATPase [Candidatus Latescibacterota bacterium]
MSQQGLFKAADILKENTPPLKWLVPGILAREGVTYCIAPPKKGKTNTAFNIAVDVAVGKTALGSIPLDGSVGVLYLLLEGDRRRRRVYRLLKSILDGKDCPDNLHVFTTETFPLMPSAIDKIADILDQHPDIGLVIIDRFIQIRKPRTQILYADDMEDIERIRDLGEDAGVAFLLIDHPRKQESANWVDLVAGSYGVAGTVDNLLFLDRKEGSDAAKLKVQGRDVEENVFTTSFDRRTRRLTVTGCGYLPPSLQAVVDFMAKEGAVSVKRVADYFDIEAAAAKKRIDRLVKLGRVAHTGREQYAIPTPAMTAAMTTTPVTTTRSGVLLNQFDDGEY